MTPIVHNIGVRLARALGYEVDPQYFNEEAAWQVVDRMAQLREEGKRLDPNVLHLCEELAMALNVRGGDESQFHGALSAQLGPSHVPVSVIVDIVKWVRSQLHFVVRKQPVQLHMHSREFVPLKSLDLSGESAPPNEEDEEK